MTIPQQLGCCRIYSNAGPTCHIRLRCSTQDESNRKCTVVGTVYKSAHWRSRCYEDLIVNVTGVLPETPRLLIGATWENARS